MTGASVREQLKDVAAAIGVDSSLRELWFRLSPHHQQDRREERSLRALLAAHLSADSNGVDVGAYRGRVLAELVRAAPRGRHIAYEPLPHLHARLVKRFPSVDVRLAALSNVTGDSPFTYVADLPAYSGLKRRSYPRQVATRTMMVRTDTLDRSLPPGYVPALIKVDVEGAEGLVLEGAIETLRRYRPIVVFEHGKGGADHYGTTPVDIFRLLCSEARLRVYDLLGCGPYSLRQFEETFARNDRWNFVARP